MAEAAGHKWKPKLSESPSESQSQSDPLSPPPAPETREAPPTPKAETRASQPNPPPPDKAEDNPVLKQHVLRDTEVRPIHRLLGRLLNKAGMPLEADEAAALDEHGARFWSRWIRTSWGASALAYAGTWGEIAISRAIERAIAARQAKRDAKATDTDGAAAAQPEAPKPPAQPKNGATTPVADLKDNASEAYRE